MSKACESVTEIVQEVQRILGEDRRNSPKDEKATYWFRGEGRNHDGGNDDIGTGFQPYLYRNEGWWKNERRMYEEALRLNVASFAEDTRMSERIARMQHYQLPTRFCDISNNALLSTLFAADESDENKGRDGFVRIIKVDDKKMKSFTSDIIIAISHLPLVDTKNLDLNDVNGRGLHYLTYEIANERPSFYSAKDNEELGRQLQEQIQQVWAFRPIMNNRRIRAQGGAFLAFGCGHNKKPLDATFAPEDYKDKTKPTYGIKQIGFVRIAAGKKEEIRKQLRHFGMPAEDVYPDLTEVCKCIGKEFKKGETTMSKYYTEGMIEKVVTEGQEVRFSLAPAEKFFIERNGEKGIVFIEKDGTVGWNVRAESVDLLFASKIAADILSQIKRNNLPVRIYCEDGNLGKVTSLEING